MARVRVCRNVTADADNRCYGTVTARSREYESLTPQRCTRPHRTPFDPPRVVRTNCGTLLELRRPVGRLYTGKPRVKPRAL